MQPISLDIFFSALFCCIAHFNTTHLPHSRDSHLPNGKRCCGWVCDKLHTQNSRHARSVSRHSSLPSWMGRRERPSPYWSIQDRDQGKHLCLLQINDKIMLRRGCSFGTQNHPTVQVLPYTDLFSLIYVPPIWDKLQKQHKPHNKIQNNEPNRMELLNKSWSKCSEIKIIFKNNWTHKTIKTRAV